MSNIEKIALGTAQFGLDYGISNNQGQTSLCEIQNILELCQKRGINTLDTAMAYGNSEENLGKFDIQRFKVVSKFILENDNIEILLKESLFNLNLPFIYGYLYHRPLEVARANWEQLQELKSKKYINKVGFSFNTIDEVSFVLDKGFIPDLIQIPFNVFDNRFEKIARDLKLNYNTEIHSRSTFLQGLFFINPKRLNAYFNSIKFILVDLQNKFKNELPVLLMEYVLRQRFIDKMVLGVNNKEQLGSNVKSLLNFSSGNSLEYISVDDKYIIPSLWEI